MRLIKFKLVINWTISILRKILTSTGWLWSIFRHMTLNVSLTGTLCFAPGETEKSFSLIIIDDDIFEEDEHFECKLSNVRLNSANGKEMKMSQSLMFIVRTAMRASVMIKISDTSQSSLRLLCSKKIFFCILFFSNKYKSIAPNPKHLKQKRLAKTFSCGNVQIKLQRWYKSQDCVAYRYYYMFPYIRFIRYSSSQWSSSKELPARYSLNCYSYDSGWWPCWNIPLWW